MNKDWNGIERRKKAEDHDTLIETLQILKNHVDNFNLYREDYKDHKKDYMQHKEEDQVNFKRIDRHIYYATGIITALIFFIRVIFK